MAITCVSLPLPFYSPPSPQTKLCFAFALAETMFWYRPQVHGVRLGPHRAHTATLVGFNIFVFGGGAGSTYYDTLYVLNTSESTTPISLCLLL